MSVLGKQTFKCCAAVRATCRKQQAPQLLMKGRGGVWIVCSPKLSHWGTMDNVSTILSPIVALVGLKGN